VGWLIRIGGLSIFMNLSLIFCSYLATEKLDVDLKQLEDYCYQLESLSKGREKSNVGGWQSEDLNQSDPIINSLAKQLILSASPLIEYSQFKGNIGISNIWININRKHCYNRTHNHPNSLISGTFYIKVPENSGNIIFENPNECLRYCLTPELKGYNEINSIDWTYKPQPGTVLYFPGYLKHFVEPNNTTEDRISLAFNIALINESYNPSTLYSY